MGVGHRLLSDCLCLLLLSCYYNRDIEGGFLLESFHGCSELLAIERVLFIESLDCPQLYLLLDSVLQRTFGSFLMSGIRKVARLAMVAFCCAAMQPRTDEKGVEDNVLD